MTAGAGDAERTAERAARLSYGRLLALLAGRWRDVAAAEDALGDAFARALETWPVTGVPANPDAWLLTAAKNRLKDGARASKTRIDAADTVRLLYPEDGPVAAPIPDRRLALLYVCAHPQIDPAMHTPLMLQTVLGLNAARIASAFLVSPATMGQRLVRAKARIQEAGIPFELPEREVLAERTEAVREAIYAAYGTGWDGAPGGDPALAALTGEAIWLAEVLTGLLPEDAESRGLLALMLFCEARTAARRGPDGDYVPFTDQNPRDWNAGMIARAERELDTAAAAARPGRFQIEAAIQSAMVHARVTGRDLSRPLVTLYATLLGFAPTIGNRLGHAAAVADAEGPDAGLRLLEAIPPARIADHQPAWALRGHLLARKRDGPAAAEAFRRAAGLSDDDAVRRFLLKRAQDQDGA